jgi:hypothetical protein
MTCHCIDNAYTYTIRWFSAKSRINFAKISKNFHFSLFLGQKRRSGGHRIGDLRIADLSLGTPDGGTSKGGSCHVGGKFRAADSSLGTRGSVWIPAPQDKFRGNDKGGRIYDFRLPIADLRITSCLGSLGRRSCRRVVLLFGRMP